MREGRVGILKGALSVRRYRVEGEVPEGREWLMEALNANAFQEPLSPVHKEERAGWVQIHNLLDLEFHDINLWLYNQYALFALRIDKKTVPAKLFKARLEKEIEAWKRQTGRERIGAREKEEIKERLELDMLRQTLPKVNVCEVEWNLTDGQVAFHNQSDKVNDLFRKLFHRSFGKTLIPVTPLDFIGDRPEEVERLMVAGLTEVGGAEAGEGAGGGE